MALSGAWRDGALCPQIDTALWFPEVGQHAKPAKTVCGMCVVREDCRDDALERRERHGVWGGHLLRTISGRKAALAEAGIVLESGDDYLTSEEAPDEPDSGSDHALLSRVGAPG
ncbi:WhiB family transcriptional regulator [Segniliparus rugosus]|uniref:Transcriptional regulator WhiB n=1 Tax=Segniliparus rugosus (strain ATCC BAA-974 / DSM 45345 / CCUG 50838 / CIP 108380 / JCM 13579 / CDC 945) TaxID=679197 RepID=E5XRW4_SEGRC|nr:WhiB family transcriptional regulator [Segniliparus rugosus]EFV12899.1 hypothetical protein HMPREF9336_02236 [Segniliparus rugosus ATCC BAA-974]